MSYGESHAIKLRLAHAYGVRPSRYELDHIIPLELGGSNALSNLQLQSWTAARAKDLDEDALHALVCADRLPLDRAQKAMRDWAPGLRS